MDTDPGLNHVLHGSTTGELLNGSIPLLMNLAPPLPIALLHSEWRRATDPLCRLIREETERERRRVRSELLRVTDPRSGPRVCDPQRYTRIRPQTKTSNFNRLHCCFLEGCPNDGRGGAPEFRGFNARFIQGNLFRLGGKRDGSRVECLTVTFSSILC